MVSSKKLQESDDFLGIFRAHSPIMAQKVLKKDILKKQSLVDEFINEVMNESESSSSVSSKSLN